MVVVPLPSPVNSPLAAQDPRPKQSNEWLRYAAGGALAAGGILLLSGKRRAGLLTASTGAALAMLDQQETVEAWWLALPGLIEDAERMLTQVEGVMNNLDAQRAKIRALVKKEPRLERTPGPRSQTSPVVEVPQP